MLYLDNSATTPVYPEVIEVMADVMKNHFGNPSSLHGLGVKAERLVEQSRKVIAQAMKASPEEIFFTSGGTESDNLAIMGAARAYQNRGKHLITSEVEHPAVYEVMEQLQQEGFEITFLPVDNKGKVKIEELKKAIREDTIIVSIMHVNNEVGTIQPIEEIGRLLSTYPKILFHVDAVQSFGKLPISVRELGVDLCSVSAHKLHGPKGIGALYVRKGVQLEPILRGGGQERNLRSGTHNVSAIAGFAKAVLMSLKLQKNKMTQFTEWKRKLVEEIEEHLPFAQIVGDTSLNESVPYLLNISFPGFKSEVIVHALEEQEIYVSSKSACSSKIEKPSRVLLAMGCSNEVAVSAIRLSLGYLSQKEDFPKAFQALQKIIPTLQQVMKVQTR
ncbi:cysteine desulfurase family protein [Risungbinella massiliensis]|uniref:cysteine desulfurase family protein n=1 Tax=Risungbinella massiliensis TaxID=1329796 RepID=UPI0005CC8F60|nr:cysteine desulfurase family protein [Risungbinella massiliensis]